jgi:hypothetical protein
MPLVVAEFDDPSPAREAMLALERKGFDANDICLGVVGRAADNLTDPAHTRQVDKAVVVGATEYALLGVVLGAAVGAAIGIGALLLLGIAPGNAMVGGAILGVIVGGLMGGLWSSFGHMAANPEAFDTYGVDPAAPEPVTVEVRAEDDEHVAAAREVLSALHPRRLDVA